MLLSQQSNLLKLTPLVMPGLKPKRLKVSSDYLKVLHTPQKQKDLKDMLQPFKTASHQLKTVLISTTMFSRQDFMLLNLKLTTLREKLHSQKTLSTLGNQPPPLLKLNNSDKSLTLGENLLSLKTSLMNLRSLIKNLSNMLLFLTFLNLGKTISAEVLNSTWLISLLHQQVNKQLPKRSKMLKLLVRLLNKILITKLSPNPVKPGLNQLKFKNQFNNSKLGPRPNKLKISRITVKL